jgi:hypothetical protein
MVKKPTIILLILLAALGLFAWWFEFSPDSDSRKSTPSATAILKPFANWKFENTALIEFKKSDDTTLTLRLGKDITTWTIEELTSTKADTGKVFQLMSELLAIDPVAKMESITDKNSMGLGDDADVLRLEDSNGSSIVTQFGSETPTKSGTYIKVGSDFYIINTPVIENLRMLLTTDGLLSPTQQSSPVSTNEQP